MYVVSKQNILIQYWAQQWSMCESALTKLNRLCDKAGNFSWFTNIKDLQALTSGFLW